MSKHRSFRLTVHKCPQCDCDMKLRHTFGNYVKLIIETLASLLGIPVGFECSRRCPQCSRNFQIAEQG